MNSMGRPELIKAIRIAEKKLSVDFTLEAFSVEHAAYKVIRALIASREIINQQLKDLQEEFDQQEKTIVVLRGKCKVLQKEISQYEPDNLQDDDEDEDNSDDWDCSTDQCGCAEADRKAKAKRDAEEAAKQQLDEAYFADHGCIITAYENKVIITPIADKAENGKHFAKALAETKERFGESIKKLPLDSASKSLGIHLSQHIAVDECTGIQLQLDCPDLGNLLPEQKFNVLMKVVEMLNQC